MSSGAHQASVPTGAHAPVERVASAPDDARARPPLPRTSSAGRREGRRRAPSTDPAPPPTGVHNPVDICGDPPVRVHTPVDGGAPALRRAHPSVAGSDRRPHAVPRATRGATWDGGPSSTASTAPMTRTSLPGMTEVRARPGDRGPGDDARGRRPERRPDGADAHPAARRPALGRTSGSPEIRGPRGPASAVGSATAPVRPPGRTSGRTPTARTGAPRRGRSP